MKMLHNNLLLDFKKFQPFQDLLIKTFDRLFSIFVLLAIGFGFGRGTTQPLTEDVPFLALLSLLVLFCSTLIDCIQDTAHHDAQQKKHAS
jgi:hypothetical protein